MRFYYLIIAIALFFNGFAQNPCATTEATRQWFDKHPELKAGFEKHLAASAKAVNDHFGQPQGKGAGGGTAQSASVYTIPVVFHILHTGGPENISDAQIFD